MDPKMYPQGKNAVSGRDGAVVQAAIYAPTSGPTGTGAGTFGWPSALLFCSLSKALFVNEGTLASPYWTPANFNAVGLTGYHANFANNVGKALADTAAYADLGQGIKVAGSDVTQTDSGLVITNDSNGRIGRLTVTATSGKCISLSPCGTAAMFKPTGNGPFVVDSEFTNVSAVTLRDIFLGFVTTNANTDATNVTATTATVSFAASIGDDVAGIFMGSALTLSTNLMCIHDKANSNATQLVSASGVNSGLTMPAAGTYGRFRVECDEYGGVRYFFNKAQIGYAAAALTLTTAVTPRFYLGSNSAAVKSVDMKHFSTWGVRA